MDNITWLAVGAMGSMAAAGVALTTIVVKVLWMLAKELNAINVDLTILNSRVGHSEQWQQKREFLEEADARTNLANRHHQPEPKE